MSSPDSRPQNLVRGSCGEATAAAVLEARGYTILARNWRYRHCELDLICEKSGEIIFIEVKTRRNHARGGGSGAITPKKRANLIKAAQKWLLVNNAWSRPCRFDVICLYGTGPTLSVEHYENAFCQTLDSSNANWQSW